MNMELRCGNCGLKLKPQQANELIQYIGQNLNAEIQRKMKEQLQKENLAVEQGSMEMQLMRSNYNYYKMQTMDQNDIDTSDDDQGMDGHQFEPYMQDLAKQQGLKGSGYCSGRFCSVSQANQIIKLDESQCQMQGNNANNMCMQAQVPGNMCSPVNCSNQTGSNSQMTNSSGHSPLNTTQSDGNSQPRCKKRQFDDDDMDMGDVETNCQSKDSVFGSDPNFKLSVQLEFQSKRMRLM